MNKISKMEIIYLISVLIEIMGAIYSFSNGHEKNGMVLLGMAIIKIVTFLPFMKRNYSYTAMMSYAVAFPMMFSMLSEGKFLYTILNYVIAFVVVEIIRNMMKVDLKDMAEAFIVYLIMTVIAFLTSLYQFYKDIDIEEIFTQFAYVMSGGSVIIPLVFTFVFLNKLAIKDLPQKYFQSKNEESNFFEVEKEKTKKRYKR